MGVKRRKNLKWANSRLRKMLDAQKRRTKYQKRQIKRKNKSQDSWEKILFVGRSARRHQRISKNGDAVKAVVHDLMKANGGKRDRAAENVAAMMESEEADYMPSF